ncbi:thiolase family protein [Halieaceae bacterium IMCC14734]|uniref:Thiolase family protein n=1 Tax=Candidatus Litorirhabdus singularis TaxID=2518993 RepID=A0ABT3TLH7_9GAMM|nr:thiolase family protein [Candidatus Litorirhabdus singularis]MCX2982849.1 thiolase family protein [Candidatus Litorirhabdus singularis]
MSGSALRGQVAIVGAADTDVGVLPGRTPMELCVEAALAAIADAGLDKSDVDGLITCNAMAQPMLYHAEAAAEYMQIFPRYCFAAGAGGGTTFSVIHHAMSAIATGMADVIVVSMADAMRSGLTREQAMLVQASTGHPEFEQPYGVTVPAYYALIAQAHMAEFGTTEAQFAGIAVACREHASRNPTAQMRDPITVADVLESRLIADPLHLLDCSLVSDGGSAVVLMSAERAADTAHAPVYILGAGEGHSHEHISAARSLTTSAAKEAGERAFAMAGLGPAEMDFAQLYDCFTPTVMVELEDLGFCAKGEGGAFVDSGALLPGGALPVNTHGGLLSHCHPGNPGSMFALTESVWQLRGSCGERQVAGATNALVHAQGGIMSSHAALVLGKEVG